MVILHEQVGFAPGETVQIADRSGADPYFNSVVLRRPEYDALEPMLRAAQLTLPELWRYGETELSAASAEHLATLLAALEPPRSMMITPSFFGFSAAGSARAWQRVERSTS